MVKWPKRLRKDREFAYNGTADCFPTETYTAEESSEVIAVLEQILARLRTWK